MPKKQKLTWFILIIFGFVLLLNILGLIVEFLFTINIISTDLANVRTFHPISLTLSLAFIISNAIFLIKLHKHKKGSILWWHIFMGLWAVGSLYQFFKPTYISLLVPFYTIISLIAAVMIWGAVFFYLEKIKHYLS